MTTLYEKDFCQWSLTQACHLRNKDLSQLDFENLIEEIESLAKRDKRKLESLITRLMIHKIKLEYAKDQKGNSNSWDSSIIYSRRDIRMILRDSPSLRNKIEDLYNDCYEDAKETASLETQIIIEEFPKNCPWTIEEILEEKK